MVGLCTFSTMAPNFAREFSAALPFSADLIWPWLLHPRATLLALPDRIAMVEYTWRGSIKIKCRESADQHACCSQ